MTFPEGERDQVKLHLSPLHPPFICNQWALQPVCMSIHVSDMMSGNLASLFSLAVAESRPRAGCLTNSQAHSRFCQFNRRFSNPAQRRDGGNLSSVLFLVDLVVVDLIRITAGACPGIDPCLSGSVKRSILVEKQLLSFVAAGPSWGCRTSAILQQGS